MSTEIHSHLDETGIIYTGCSNGIRAVDSANGSTVWNAGFLDSIVDDIAYYDGMVYAIGYSSSSSTYLYAYDTSGDQLWKTLLGIYMGGLVVDSNRNVFVTGYYKLWKVDASDDISFSINPGSTYNYGPIFDAAGNIYFGGSTTILHSRYATGNARWEYTQESDDLFSPVLDDQGTPSQFSDDVVYVGSRDDSLHAVNASDGSDIWRFNTSGDIYAQPIIGPDGTIYIGSYDDKFYAINPNGTLKWSFDASGDIFSAAALSADGNIYFGSKNASKSGWSVIYSLDASGNQRWNLELYGGDYF